jgi:hypothetical protein
LARDVESQIQYWLQTHKKAITKDEASYIKNHLHQNHHSPFRQFYVSYKVTKKTVNGNYPTRPVCLDLSSLLHGLGKWVDLKLQPIAHSQPSDFKDSIALKSILSNLNLPPNALLFTADAKSMCTNICTEPALFHITQLLQGEAGQTFYHYDTNTLTAATKIVF